MSVASTTDIAGLVAPTAAPPRDMTTREMAPRTRALLEGPIVPVLLRLAAPNFIVMATQIVVGVVETYFVGWLGADALAGVSLAFPLLMLMQTMAAEASAAALRPRSRGRLGPRSGTKRTCWHFMPCSSRSASVSSS